MRGVLRLPIRLLFCGVAVANSFAAGNPFAALKLNDSFM